MHDVDLLVPFARVEAELARDLLRDAELPHLSQLLRAAETRNDVAMPADSPLVPWQAWLFVRRALDLDDDRWMSRIDDINLAELWAMACGVPPYADEGRWLAEPAHFTVARDHLRLDDPGALTMSIDEARDLARAASPALTSAGWTLAPIEAATVRHWFMTREDPIDLSGPAIERAIGENVAAWQPRSTSPTPPPSAPPIGAPIAAVSAARATASTASARTSIAASAAAPTSASTTASATVSTAALGAASILPDPSLAWRRCINEIQMSWFDHPVNAAREARGLPAINTLWLSGNGRPRAPLPRYRAIDSHLSLVTALQREPGATRALETFDGLIEAARAEAWDTWRQRLSALDARIDTLERGRRDGTIGALSIVLCGQRSLLHLGVARRSARGAWHRAWRRLASAPSLVDALTDGGGGVEPRRR